MSTELPVDRTQALYGAVTGGAAYALGYLLTYTWKATAVSESLRGINAVAELLGAEAIPAWKAVGWLFYSAHLAATRVPTLGGGTTMVNLVERSGDGSLALLYLLVPALLLLAGIAAARLGGTDDAVAGAVAGAAVAVGYLPLALGGAVVLVHPIGETGARVAPDPVGAALIAGLVYPLAFGAVGGAVAGALSGR